METLYKSIILCIWSDDFLGIGFALCYWYTVYYISMKNHRWLLGIYFIIYFIIYHYFQFWAVLTLMIILLNFSSATLWFSNRILKIKTKLKKDANFYLINFQLFTDVDIMKYKLMYVSSKSIQLFWLSQ